MKFPASTEPKQYVWTPPVPAETLPAGEWVEVARYHYPSTRVRAAITLNSAEDFLHRLVFDLHQAPPVLAPLNFWQTDYQTLYAHFTNEFVARRLCVYLNDLDPLESGVSFNFVPIQPYETITTAWQFQVGLPYTNITFSVHPYPTFPGIVIEAAPDISSELAEAAAQGILNCSALLRGYRTSGPFAYLCFRLYRIESQIQPGFTEKNNRTFDIVAQLQKVAVEALLAQVETAHFAPTETSPIMQATYPRPVARPILIHQPAAAQKRRHLKPIGLSHYLLISHDEYIQVALVLMPATDAIICETHTTSTQVADELLAALFDGLIENAADLMGDGIPLVGFRVTILSESQFRSSNALTFRQIGAQIIARLWHIGETVIVENNLDLQ